MTNEYPECEKLAEQRDEVNNLIEFMAFLRRQGIQFGSFGCPAPEGYLSPVNLEREGEVMAAKFLGVDMAKVDKERIDLEKSLR